MDDVAIELRIRALEFCEQFYRGKDLTASQFIADAIYVEEWLKTGETTKLDTARKRLIALAATDDKAA